MCASSSNRATVCVCQWERSYWRVGQCWRDWKGVDVRVREEGKGGCGDAGGEGTHQGERIG